MSMSTSKMRKWEIILYFALLSFVYVYGFVNAWINGWNLLANILYIPNLVQFLFWPPLSTLVPWYIIVKIGDLLRLYRLSASARTQPPQPDTP